MEVKQQKIRITYDEMHKIRKMGREQLERYLTEVMQMGYRQGYTDSETETDAELRLAEEDNKETLRLALEAHDQKWKKAVRDAVDAMKGIRKKKKELLMEYVKTETERKGICRK